MNIAVSIEQPINEEQLTPRLYYRQLIVSCISAISRILRKTNTETAFKLVLPWLVISYHIRIDQLTFDSKELSTKLYYGLAILCHGTRFTSQKRYWPVTSRERVLSANKYANRRSTKRQGS